MAWEQHIMRPVDFDAAGGEISPMYEVTDDTVVIVCVDEAGNVAWVSYAEEAEQPAFERLNPDIPAKDWRP